MDENANPQGSENPANENIEAAFDQYLERQANAAGDAGSEQQTAAGAENGQPDGASKPAGPEQPGEQEQRFKVKVNGEEREVPLAELVKGYQLESDYRIKTSQVAEQSRTAQAQIQQAQAVQAQYAQALQVQMQYLATMRPQPPDPALIETDPVGFLRQQQAMQSWQGQMQRAQQESHQLQLIHSAQEAQAAQAALSAQAEQLIRAIPEWSDAEKAKAGKADVIKFLRSSGFSDEEINNARDHRAVLMARKAMLYDQMMEKQASTTARVANLPP